MNKRHLHGALIAILLAFVPGCGERQDLEDATIPFAVGYDLDDANDMIVYATSPVFYRNVEKKTHEIQVKARTSRQARKHEDSYSTGSFNGRKIQVILVGKRFLAHEGWFSMFDVYFRDSKNSLSQRIVACDGPVSEIMYLNPKDQPMLPMLLRGMVDTKSDRSETVKTTLQELHRHMYEKGMTPSISEVRLDKDKKIVLSGTALLDHHGKYAVSLDIPDTVLLHILQRRAHKPVGFTVPVPGEPKRGPFAFDRVSFNAEDVKTKIKTSFRENKFHFDIRVNMPIVLTEMLFDFDVQKKGEQLEKTIAEQMEGQFARFIGNIQARRLDPIGLGLYARAYAYERYKQAEDNWVDTLAAADIRVSVKVKLKSMGPVK